MEDRINNATGTDGEDAAVGYSHGERRQIRDSYYGYARVWREEPGKFQPFFCLTLNTGADVTRRLLFTEFDYLREANGNDDARVFEHAARDTATAMSSRSVLGNVEARGRAHDYTKTDSDCDAVHVNKTDDNSDCITTNGV